MNFTEQVRVDTGLVRGQRISPEDTVRIFKGIPYALPPVGALRWKPPQPPSPWEGVRECVAFGQSCPATDWGDRHATTGEDCLTLNVWTTSLDPADRRPVMVWVHGGGRGENLAGRGVVVVTFNFRTGPLGFLAHPLLSRESPHGVSGNYGILDQIEALRWVQRNIRAFGGDPGCVTVFGESSGGISVCNLMVSPLAAGLFHRAISESGGPLGIRYVLPWADGLLAEEEETGVELARRLQCHDSPDILEALRAVEPQQLLAASHAAPGPFNRGMRFEPVLDGRVIPSDPQALFASGRCHDVPMILGSNADEGSRFAQDMTVDEYLSWVRTMCLDSADDLLALFPAACPEDVASSFNKLFTVMAFVYPARFVARAMERKRSRAYLYHFTRVPPVREAQKHGAYHGLEVSYVFGNLPDRAGYEEKDLRLSDAMMRYWTAFAREGHPRCPGLPVWPPYSSAEDNHMEFGEEIGVRSGLFREACDAMEIPFRAGSRSSRRCR